MRVKNLQVGNLEVGTLEASVDFGHAAGLSPLRNIAPGQFRSALIKRAPGQSFHASVSGEELLTSYKLETRK